ncbi:THUMP domain-containing class I SAM-dependent RNA methyltransferase [Primorskyibacter sp. S187A]|uniref:THUMP domain-containing class I SAM-dependent RNA methyltransferase n=1 Tax=Primorskyibacter sp. S187A TaxID=3415130 RepID=UPI003C7E4482
MDKFQIFLAAIPGLEEPLRAEALDAGFHSPRIIPGGVIFDGTWQHVWRANLHLRGAVRVLARVAVFKAHHLKQIEPETRAIDWPRLIPEGTAFHVEATCRKSRLNHAGAVAQRIAAGIASACGAALSEDKDTLRIMARVEKDFVTLSLDTSGAPLHKRGHKEAVGKAPLRETIAAMALRLMNFSGHETLVDPMCGSGTFPIEAAEIAAGLAPGRTRSFSFEQLKSFDAQAWDALKDAPASPGARMFHGFDRDAGAIAGAKANAARAGVSEACAFAQAPLAAQSRPAGPPGLIMVNPPYGTRIGDRRALFALYGALGQTMRAQYSGWRFGMITSDGGLAKATGLTLDASEPIAFGGLKVKLYSAQL